MHLGEPAAVGAPAEEQRRQRLGKLANLHHALALVTVRGVAGDEYQQRGRQELHQPDHAEVEGAAGEIIDLPADRDRSDLAGETRQASRQQEEDKGALPQQSGGALPFDLKTPGADFILAFQALPIVLIMSVLTTLLFYWRVLPPVVRGMAWLLEHTLGVGGAVGLSTAANIFLGMVEAPLFVRPYLQQMTRSEFFLLMTGGMAGIAGTVLVLYATLLAPLIPDAAAHFVIASVLGAPAAILISMIMVPETSDQRTGGALEDPDAHASSTMDAIVKGTTSGLELLLNIIAMLLVLVALVYL